MFALRFAQLQVTNADYARDGPMGIGLKCMPQPGKLADPLRSDSSLAKNPIQPVCNSPA